MRNLHPNYDKDFFDYLNTGSLRSAKVIVPILKEYLDSESVLDVGCGQGAWLSVWKKEGVIDVYGVDGDYVDAGNLLINNNEFMPIDLKNDFNLDRKFNLVMSLEVAEHIPEQQATIFINNLVRHGDAILFSAATKGQGGDHHVNEQDYDYWRQIFSQHGYYPFDFIRHDLKKLKNIEPWYRYNILLYVSKSKFDDLSSLVIESRVHDNEKINDVSPYYYQIRKAIVALLPMGLVTKIAKLKEKAIFYFRTKYR